MSLTEQDERHDNLVRIIAESVAGLLPQFAARGLTIEMLVEGAVKGVTVAMMTNNAMTLAECAAVLEEITEQMRAEVPGDNDNGQWPPRAN
ncbi:hypothetical protein [Devosia sp.]|uniref:hypothetical protein n=1 Tax=Devosia sp. TaxID=1871048 RepID=UPI0019DF3997|nr:hypothetical protein [Devosia sp.]MBE0580821.1 hypothetical protein [Devosia sp.]